MTRTQRRLAIVRAYQAGEPVVSIAERFGVTSSAVVQCARRAGVPPHNQKLSDSRKQALASGIVRQPVRSAIVRRASVVESIDGGGAEHPMLNEMRRDPGYVEIAPRQFIKTASFRKYGVEARLKQVKIPDSRTMAQPNHSPCQS